ncbi:MAG: peptide chain release factor N(5)-glutamine methyltransferase [Pseudomonadota bacterium]
MTNNSVYQCIRDGAAKLTWSTTPFIDARVMMKSLLGYDDADLIAFGEQELATGTRQAFSKMIARRCEHEPVALIVRKKEFWGLTFETKKGVLIPRPDSETVITACLDVLQRDDAPLKILDAGVGTGCLLGALLTELPNAYGVGVDINPDAAFLAKRNLEVFGLQLRSSIYIGNWLDAIDTSFDLIVANPPYIKSDVADTLNKDIVNYEDPCALFSGRDGFDAYRTIIPTINDRLRQGGHAVIEIGAGQRPEIEKLIAKAGARFQSAYRDLNGIDRAIVFSHQ